MLLLQQRDAQSENKDDVAPTAHLAAEGIAAAGLTVVCAGVATAVVPFSPAVPTPTPVAQSANTGEPRGVTQSWGVRPVS